MKSLESIYESILLENQNTNNIDIELLKKYVYGTPGKYTINDDGSIDVKGSVNVNIKNIAKIPFKFGIVSGNFNCSDNQLTSLLGAPKTVGGSFYCSNNQLTSLEGAPNSVGGDFYCSNNQLTSLEGVPKTVGGNFFYCSNNHLTSLDGAPNFVGGNFYCYDNPNLSYTELFKIIDNVKGNIYYSSKTIPEDKDKIRRDRDVKGVLKDDELGSLYV